MLKYELKFYCNGTKLTGNEDNSKTVLLNEFERLSNMEVEDINSELGLNDDLTVTHILLMDNRTEEVIREFYF